MARSQLATGKIPNGEEQALYRSQITAKFFRGLADVNRLQIIELLLARGERNVSQLVVEIGQPQGRISTHLACLKWCGYVTSRRDGKYVYYSVADERVEGLVCLAREMISDHAEAILDCTRIDG